ncbi:helix-turn-helix domain-containing protein [Natranaerobius trueperi]|uniref:Cytoskeleton protein RodZ-like C-terminal domain-containing protein n=1 Tax=Natranaerobius trueperi TaxID=759412 RepID=A0A226C1L7_9FIRM|nr:RodZ domain-containing protein [Natranaerobius trueperi]OWZ84307.1 hypothetical protein CDO51_04410 [Natranaerobius trueperi]
MTENEDKTTEDIESTAKGIGDKLKKARQTQGLSIYDIQQITKLRSKYIRSIEEGDFSVFPGEVYAKGAIKNYAETVNYDFKELWNDYETIFSKSETSNHDQLNENNGGQVKETMLTGFIEKVLPDISKALIMVVIIGLLVSGGYRGYDFLAGIDLGTEEVENESNGEITENDNEISENSEDNEKNNKEEQIEPELSIEKISSDPIKYEISGTEKATLDLSITDTCWTKIILDGETQSLENYGELTPGTEKSLIFENKINFTFGYAAGVELFINDEELEVPDTAGTEYVEIEIIN